MSTLDFLLSTLDLLLSTLDFLLSTLDFLLSTLDFLLSTLDFLLSTFDFCCQLSTFCCRLFTFTLDFYSRLSTFRYTRFLPLNNQFSRQIKCLNKNSLYISVAKVGRSAVACPCLAYNGKSQDIKHWGEVRFA